jgi:hypothetical protein
MVELSEEILVQKAVETHKAFLERVTQQQKVAADFATLAIRSLILVSGGALIAILTFLGNLWTKDDAIAQGIAHSMTTAVKWFAFALFMSLLTAILAYFSSLAQVYRLTRQSTFLARRAFRIRGVAVVAALVSLVVIGIAFFVAANGLSGTTQH